MNGKGGFQFININMDSFDVSGENPTQKIDGIYDKLESNRGKPIYLTIEGNTTDKIAYITSPSIDGTDYVLGIQLQILTASDFLVYIVFKINSDDIVTQYTKLIAFSDIDI